jgi:chromosomal replication initiator protein
MMESWAQTLDTLKTEVSPHTFNTWFKPLQCKTFEQDKILIEVPNTYYKEKIQKEYSNILLSRLRQVTMNENVQLSFVLSDEKNSTPQNILIPVEVKELKKDASLNSKFTFDSFVVGNQNQFAHAACQAVANAPGKTYNPLFLYGGVGLGKTHLLSAIGNEILQSKQRLKVVYRSSEQFMNELINSIRLSKMDEFRSLYRHCDVLLLDDIHFFTGKERTQEEFFHTFNALHQNGKQIVLSSDRMPNEIPDLDERLRSRFQAGLFCDIQKPDVETRVAILRKKADQFGLVISDHVLFVLADAIDSNIRILEGCLTKLSAISSLSKRPIDESLVKEVVFSITTKEKILSTEEILKAVSSFFHLKSADLKSARKHKVVAQPRQIAMYLSRKLTSLSYPELGQKFGGKDHTTIMHGFSKIEKELEINPQLRSTIMAIEKSLQT